MCVFIFKTSMLIRVSRIRFYEFCFLFLVAERIIMVLERCNFCWILLFQIRTNVCIDIDPELVITIYHYFAFREVANGVVSLLFYTLIKCLERSLNSWFVENSPKINEKNETLENKAQKNIHQILCISQNR